MLSCNDGDSHDPSYQTVRGLNPLKSFAQMGGGPPPVSSSSGSPFLSNNVEQRKASHVVRPVVFASPTLRGTISNGKPAGVVIGLDLKLLYFY